MNSEKVVQEWFTIWRIGDFLNLPITEDFTHVSPFGTINGKKAYLNLVESNKEKFLGYIFQIHDSIYETSKACVRYTAKQGENFSLDVSEWYYFKEGLITKVIAYYHIGDIREDRKLSSD